MYEPVVSMIKAGQNICIQLILTAEQSMAKVAQLWLVMMLMIYNQFACQSKDISIDAVPVVIICTNMDFKINCYSYSS